MLRPCRTAMYSLSHSISDTPTIVSSPSNEVAVEAVDVCFPFDMSKEGHVSLEQTLAHLRNLAWTTWYPGFV